MIKKNSKIPNIITCFRVILIPAIIICFYMENKISNFFCCLIFTIACFTDFLDGYFARKYNSISDIGSTLDHVSDKLLITIIIVIIIEKTSSKYLCLPGLIIIIREIVVLSIRELIAKKQEKINLSFFYFGKIKTCFQMSSIIILLAYDINKPNYITWLGFILFYLSTFITFYSMILYVSRVYFALKKK